MKWTASDEAIVFDSSPPSEVDRFPRLLGTQ